MPLEKHIEKRQLAVLLDLVGEFETRVDFTETIGELYVNCF